MPKPKAQKRDIAKEITTKMIAAIEKGTPPWKMPWGTRPLLTPLRNTGEQYSGINILVLWDMMDHAGYDNPRWITFKQAQALGGKVKKGAKSTGIVYYGSATKTVENHLGEEEETTRRFLKHYNVFNVDQVEGLPNAQYSFPGAHIKTLPPDNELSAFFQRVGPVIDHGGNRAFYRPSSDHIQMPRFGAFQTPQLYFATLCHETIHWSGAKHRLDRLPCAPTEEERGYEELVAEIGSAMLGAQIGLPPDHLENHSAYVQSWLKSLKNDTRFILKAAAEAQKACDFVLQRAGDVLPRNETAKARQITSTPTNIAA